MNIKLISKALHTLSLLSDEDVAIVFGLRGASEDERGILMLALEPNSKSSQKKSSKKPAGKGGGGKSKHASSLQQQIKGAAKGGTNRPLEALCVADLPNGAGRCGHEEDDPLHSDTSYGNAHTYQPPATHAAVGSTGD